jgi:hypothetical protein
VFAALGFGLIHGSVRERLREFGLPREALGWSLCRSTSGRGRPGSASSRGGAAARAAAAHRAPVAAPRWIAAASWA